MPWEIVTEGGKSFVVKKGTHKKMHKNGMTREAAVKMMRALYANESKAPPPPSRK